MKEMTPLTRNPDYIRKFEKEAGPHRRNYPQILANQLDDGSNRQERSFGLNIHAPIHAFEWRQGEDSG